MRSVQAPTTAPKAPRQLELVLAAPPSAAVEAPAKRPAPPRRGPAKRRPTREGRREPRSPAAIAKRVIELLGSMGYRPSEARWLVWTALRSGDLPTHRPATQTELLRAALRAGATRRANR